MTLLLSLLFALAPPAPPELTTAESTALGERKPIVRTSADGLTVMAAMWLGGMSLESPVPWLAGQWAGVGCA